MGRIDFLDANGFLVLEKLAQRAFYVRELAEETGLAPSSIHKALKRLEKQKMVVAKNQKNRKVFSLNSQSSLVNRAVSILWVHKILNSKAFVRLVALKPVGIVMFGSAATGKISGQSDIDLAIVFSGSTNALKLTGIKRELSTELHREVQLLVLSDSKIRALQKENSELLNQVKHQGLVLWGKEIE